MKTPEGHGKSRIEFEYYGHAWQKKGIYYYFYVKWNHPKIWIFTKSGDSYLTVLPELFWFLKVRNFWSLLFLTSCVNTGWVLWHVFSWWLIRCHEGWCVFNPPKKPQKRGVAVPISNELRDAETVGQMIIGTLVTSAFTFDSQWLQVYHSLENVNHPIVPQMRKFHPLSILILSPSFQ